MPYSIIIHDIIIRVESPNLLPPSFGPYLDRTCDRTCLPTLASKLLDLSTSFLSSFLGRPKRELLHFARENYDLWTKHMKTWTHLERGFVIFWKHHFFRFEGSKNFKWVKITAMRDN